MAADPDSFDDDCRSDDSILSGEVHAGDDDSDDPEEVQTLLTTIQRTRTEQPRIHSLNPVSTSNGPATVSFCL
jgi:hypothetical protein